MTTKTKTIKLFIDTKGAMELEGLSHGTTEAGRLEDELGVRPLRSLDFLCSAVRADGLTAEDRTRVLEIARGRGWEIHEEESLGDPPKPKLEAVGEAPASTVDVIHQHSLAPSKKEKVIVPFIVLAVVAVLGAIAVVLLDHANQRYSKAANLGDLVAYASNVPAPAAGLAGLVNPDDSRYVAVDVTGWQFWSGQTAMTQNHVLTMLNLPVTVEEMVKGERGSARVELRFDVRAAEPPRFHINEILRANLKTEFENVELEIIPATVGSPPPVNTAASAEGFHSDTGIRGSNSATWKGFKKIAATGFIQRSGDGYRFRSRHYEMDLDAVSDLAVKRVLASLALSEEEGEVLTQALVPKSKVAAPGSRITVYTLLREPYDAGRRKASGAIGRAKIEGLMLGKVYLMDPGGS